MMVPGSDTTLDDKAYETIHRILGELYGKEDRAEELTVYLHGIEKDLGPAGGGYPEEQPTAYVCGVSFKAPTGLKEHRGFYGPLSSSGQQPGQHHRPDRRL
ncbi:MAG: hypothetical protein ACLU9S_17750 [Oscillospiraceae bacterium]